jgi:hypothetical protein
MNRVSLAPETAQHASALVHPGSTLVITDQPSHQGMRTEPGFTIISMTRSADRSGTRLPQKVTSGLR